MCLGVAVKSIQSVKYMAYVGTERLGVGHALNFKGFSLRYNTFKYWILNYTYQNIRMCTTALLF